MPSAGAAAVRGAFSKESITCLLSDIEEERALTQTVPMKQIVHLFYHFHCRSKKIWVSVEFIADW